LTGEYPKGDCDLIRNIVTPSASFVHNVLNTQLNLDLYIEAPHSTPRLVRVVVCLDPFGKAGAFDRINAIGFCEPVSTIAQRL
jgi:hypothetical protein